MNAKMSEDIKMNVEKAFYFGDPDTDGTWRIIREGDSLAFQRLESGEWVHKLVINP